MNIIPAIGSTIVVFNVFSVRPENQDALVECMTSGVAASANGLISAKVLKSRDGTKVINHMVWASREAFDQASAGNPAIAAARQRVHQLIDAPGPDAFDIIDVK